MRAPWTGPEAGASSRGRGNGMLNASAVECLTSSLEDDVIDVSFRWTFERLNIEMIRTKKERILFRNVYLKKKK